MFSSEEPKNRSLQARERSLRHLSPRHRRRLTFFLYFFSTIELVAMPSFSFVEADLAMLKLLIGALDGDLKLLIGARDGTLKLGCSRAI